MTLALGQTAELKRTVTAEDINAFAALTLDHNPAHLDDDFAAGTRFGRRIAHGMLVASLVGAVLGTQLPGPGTIYISQTLQFTAPVFIGDMLTARVTVVAIGERRRVTLTTDVRNADGTLVLTGTADVIAPKEAA